MLTPTAHDIHTFILVTDGSFIWRHDVGGCGWILFQGTKRGKAKRLIASTRALYAPISSHYAELAALLYGLAEVRDSGILKGHDTLVLQIDIEDVMNRLAGAAPTQGKWLFAICAARNILATLSKQQISVKLEPIRTWENTAHKLANEANHREQRELLHAPGPFLALVNNDLLGKADARAVQTLAEDFDTWKHCLQEKIPGFVKLLEKDGTKDNPYVVAKLERARQRLRMLNGENVEIPDCGNI